MLKTVRKFLALSGRKKRAVVTAWAVVILIRAGLWILAFPRLLKLVAFLSRKPRTRGLRDSDPDEFVWAVNAASHYTPKATCLTRALALNALLSRHNHTSHIKIGVAKDSSGGLKSHAWVEHDGRIILGAVEGLSDFSTLVSLERATSLLERGLPL